MSNVPKARLVQWYTLDILLSRFAHFGLLNPLSTSQLRTRFIALKTDRGGGAGRAVRGRWMVFPFAEGNRIFRFGMLIGCLQEGHLTLLPPSPSFVLRLFPQAGHVNRIIRHYSPLTLSGGDGCPASSFQSVVSSSVVLIPYWTHGSDGFLGSGASFLFGGRRRARCGARATFRLP